MVAAACGSSDEALPTAGPLPPVADLATSEGLLGTASEQLRDCLSITFSDQELQTSLEDYVQHPFTNDPFQQCDPSGMEILSSAGGAVAEGLPGAQAPFGLSDVRFPDSAAGIEAMYEQAEFRGQGTVRANEMQVEVRFDGADADAISIESEFSGLPDGTSPTVMIGTMLIFIGNDVLPDSRLGGTDGDLTWLKFVPPQTPDRHTLLWAYKNAKWAFSATADSEAELEELVRALVTAAK